MSEEDTYRIKKQQADIDESMSVEVEAPRLSEAKELFDEVWDDAE